MQYKFLRKFTHKKNLEWNELPHFEDGYLWKKAKEHILSLKISTFP